MVFQVDNREFAEGDRVRLGSGEVGRIVERVERGGLSGYRVKILDGPRKGSVVGASPSGMIKVTRRDSSTRVVVELGRSRYLCRVATTTSQHAQGLQDQPQLEPDEGLLFMFDPPRAATFHMGTVAYPIDIVFVDGERVAKVVHNASPGSHSRWSYPKCSAVLELRGGQARQAAIGARLKVAEYPAPPINNADTRYKISLPDEDVDALSIHPERFSDRGTPDETSPNADEMANDQWRNNYGYDALEETKHVIRPTAQRVSDPADFVVGIIEAMARQDRPLDWHRDVLNPALAYAVVSPDDITAWVSTYDMSGSAATDVLAVAMSRSGLRTLGDGLILAGVADIAHVAQDPNGDDILVLWTEHEDLHNGQRV